MDLLAFGAAWFPAGRVCGTRSRPVYPSVRREPWEPSGEGAQSSRRRRRLRDESGQAAVEFALVVPLLCVLILVFVDFAKAMNYWLDASRVANEGARLAAVNSAGLSPDAIKDRFLFDQKATSTVLICYPTSARGEPVTVKVTVPYNWITIPSGLPFIGGTWNVTSRATMRQEVAATYANSGAGAC
jgi:Flp pilus assembly pilin Flp